MTTSTFIAICQEATILPKMAFENDQVRTLVRSDRFKAHTQEEQKWELTALLNEIF